MLLGYSYLIMQLISRNSYDYYFLSSQTLNLNTSIVITCWTEKTFFYVTVNLLYNIEILAGQDNTMILETPSTTKFLLKSACYQPDVVFNNLTLHCNHVFIRPLSYL